ncbi:AraC family transcriptional regulator [Serratia sp. D1N4]
MSNSKTVSNIVSRFLFSFLQQHDVPAALIHHRTGISPYELTQSDSRISAAQHYRLMILVEEKREFLFNDYQPDFALTDIFRSWGTLSSLLTNSRSLRQGVANYLKYRDIIGQTDHIQVYENDEQLMLEYHNSGPEILSASLASPLGNFIILAELIGHYDRQTYASIQVTLKGTCSNSRQAQQLSSLLGFSCQMNAARNTLTFSKQNIDRPYDFYNRKLFETIQKAADSEINTLTSNAAPLTLQVKNCLRAHYQNPTLHQLNPANEITLICQKMSMPRWTLQRKLQHEGQNFTELAQQTKMEEACRLLQQRSLTLSDISELLGFSSQAAFSRFFRNKMNVSPLRYRNGCAVYDQG